MMVALVMAVVVVVMMIHDGGVVAQELLIELRPSTLQLKNKIK